MRTIRILLLRDLRRYAITLPAFVAVVIVIQYIFPLIPLFSGNSSDVWNGLICGWAMFGTSVVFDAPPHGTSEFWMTRPISGVQLSVSKLAIAILYGVLMPTLLLAVAQKFGLVTPFTHKDFLKFCSFMPLAMLLSSLSKNKWEVIAAILIFGVVSLLAMLVITPALLIYSGSLGSPAGKHIPRSDNPLWWTLVGLWNIGVIFIIIKQYMTRDRTTGIVATGGLMLLLICLAYIGLPVLMLLKS